MKQDGVGVALYRRGRGVPRCRRRGHVPTRISSELGDEEEQWRLSRGRGGQGGAGRKKTTTNQAKTPLCSRGRSVASVGERR